MALVRRLSKGKVFPGWYIVGVALIANAASAVGGYTFGLFFAPMGQSLGWSRTAISWVLTIRSVLSMPMGPLLGPLVDKKYGSTVLMACGGTFLGLGMMLTATVTQLWQFYLLFGILSGAAATAVGAGVVSPTVISKWFVRRRGRAIAISAMGTSIAGVVFVPLTSFIILHYGWRAAWLVLGLISVLLVVPLSSLFVRRTPEDIGLVPDGTARHTIPTYQEVKRRNELATSHDWTLREASRTPALWLVIAGFSFSSAGTGGILVHTIPYITDKGYSAAVAASVLTTLSVILVLMKPIWGLLGERIQARYLMSASFAMCALGLMTIVLVKEGPLIALFPAFYGVGAGAFIPIMNLTWANYFGRAYLGTIKGVFDPITHIVSAFSPVFAGYVFDSVGSYDPAFLSFSSCFVLAAIAILLARRPESIPEPKAPSRAST